MPLGVVGPFEISVAVIPTVSAFEKVVVLPQLTVVLAKVSASRVTGLWAKLPLRAKVVPEGTFVDFTVSTPEYGPVTVGEAVTGTTQSSVLAPLLSVLTVQTGVPTVKIDEPEVMANGTVAPEAAIGVSPAAK